MQEVIYSPHHDFYIDRVLQAPSRHMSTFHLHRKYEIYLQLEGERRYFIEDSVYTIQPGDLILVDRDEIHKVDSLDEHPYSRYVLNFSSACLEQLQETMASVRTYDIFKCGVKVLHLDAENLALTHGLLERIRLLSDAATREDRLLRQLILAELLLQIGRLVKSMGRKPRSDDASNEIIHRICVYIGAHYRENLKLTGIAEAFYISPSYLCRLFKRATGLSVVEYINGVRVKAAKELLESSGAKITEISERAGFSTSSHFARVFKTNTGLSPQHYRTYYKKASFKNQ